MRCAAMVAALNVPVFFLDLALAADRVTIRGKKKEKYYPRAGGRAVLIRPEDGSRMSGETHLKEESSLGLLRSDKISSTGFHIPTVRGQDQNLTEISLGNVLIYDPLSSLPLFSEPDLQAFGQMELYQGVSPWDTESVSPVGHIRYRMREYEPLRLQAGLQSGKPYGNSLWLKHSGGYDFESGAVMWKIFGRRHATDGKFSYYDDNGNPWVPEDGVWRQRENNDARTSLLIPWMRWQSRKHTAELLAVWMQKQQGLSGYGAKESFARRETGSLLISPVWSWQLPVKPGGFFPQSMKLSGLLRKDDSTITDPGTAWLQEHLRQQSRVNTHEAKLSLGWDAEFLKSTLSVQNGAAVLAHSVNDAESKQAVRKHQQAMITAWHPLWGNLSGEWKGLLRIQKDSYDAMSEWYKADQEISESGQEKTGFYRAGSFSLSWLAGSYRLYGQAAWYVRPPSLWEEFGNSDYVMPNLSLKPEKIRHLEGGVSYHPAGSGLRLHLTWFQDKTDSKILFLPAWARTFRAANIRKTRVTGVEAGGEWNSSGGLGLSLNTSLRSPVIESTAMPKKIPGTPDYRVVLAVSQRCAGFVTFRGGAAHNGPHYLDSANSMKVKPKTIWDFSTDIDVQQGKISWQSGFSIVNITNVRTMDIQAPGASKQEGVTALSEIKGYPMPGRQWTVYLTAGW